MSQVKGTPYIAWAKQKKAAWNLAVSGARHASWADLGVTPADMPLAGENLDGYAPLVTHLASRYRVRPAQVVTATGCSMANFLALAALIDRGDEVLIERPTYEPLLRAVEYVGGHVKRFERRAARGFDIDPGEVIAAISPRTRVVVLSNLHNPSSHFVDATTLRAIGGAADRVGARVLVDEVYLEAVEDGVDACVHLGPAFISTNSLTKVHGLAALRCGWVIADEALAERIRRLNDLCENVRPFAPDWLAAAAFDRLPALAARTRQLVATNRQVFAGWARDRDDLQVTIARWGTTLCLRPLVVEAAALCEELRLRYDVSLVPGHFFELPDHVRISLCTAPEVLHEGLGRLSECLTAMQHAR